MEDENKVHTMIKTLKRTQILLSELCPEIQPITTEINVPLHLIHRTLKTYPMN